MPTSQNRDMGPAPGFVAWLKQMVADEFEGVLAGPPADSFAVAGEVELFDLGVLGLGEGDVDETDWLVGVGAGSSGARAGDAGDGDAERCAGAVADSFCEGAGDFGRDGAFVGDELGGKGREGGFEGVAVDDGAAEKVARAAGDGGEALSEQAAGAAFGGGKGEVAKAEV